MKNIFKFFGTILTVVLAAFCMTGCLAEDDLGTADLGLHVKVFFPTKVVAGQPMTINGSGFAEATAIVFPGVDAEVVVTDFQIVSNDMIRVNAPKGISAEGGKIIVRTESDQAESPLPLTLGDTKISGYSANPGDQVDGGSQITIFGTDLEFITGVELLDADGNPALVSDKLFNKKATASIIFTVPKKVYEGTFVGKVYTVDGKTFEMPELTYKPASDGGYFETVQHVIWENPDPEGNGAVSWSGQYRFYGEGNADTNNECIAMIAADHWNIIKTGTFYLKFAPAADAYQIRANTGWWSFDGDGAYDIHGGDERIIDNGDGTFSLAYTLSEEPLASGILGLIDEQHLLFTGNGYTPLMLYYTEEVWVPGGAVEIVPLLAADGHIGRKGHLAHPFGVDGTHHRLHLCRMPQDPGDGQAGGGDAVARRHLLQLLIQGIVVRIAGKMALDEAELQRTPGLDGHIMEPAVIQNAVIPVDTFLVFHIHIQAGVHQHRMTQSKLKLIHHQFFRQVLVQQCHLQGIVVGYAETGHLALLLQLGKGFGHLLRLHQGIGPVQDQELHLLSPQALQAVFDRGQDMLPGKIVLSGPDAALGLDHHFLPERRVLPEDIAEQLLTAAVAAVDVRMLKKADACIQVRADQRVQFALAQPVDAHTALGDPGNGDTADGLIGHKKHPFLF